MNDKSAINYLTNFGNTLTKLIYENEEFDQYLDIEEYIKLRDITIKMKNIIEE